MISITICWKRASPKVCTHFFGTWSYLSCRKMDLYFFLSFFFSLRLLHLLCFWQISFPNTTVNLLPIENSVSSDHHRSGFRDPMICCSRHHGCVVCQWVSFHFLLHTSPCLACLLLPASLFSCSFAFVCLFGHSINCSHCYCPNLTACILILD